MKKTIEDLFLHYLNICGLSAITLPPIQYEEMKKAFFAGAASFWKLQTDYVSTLKTEEESIAALDVLDTELNAFWDQYK